MSTDVIWRVPGRQRFSILYRSGWKRSCLLSMWPRDAFLEGLAAVFLGRHFWGGSRCSVEHHHYHHTTFITSSRETGLIFCEQIRFELLQGHSWWWDPSSRSTEPGMVLVYTVYTGLLKSCFKRRRETLDQHRNRRFDGEFGFASMWFPIPPIMGY